ncbi:hypothetical protein Pmar_PMAR018400 [Perkinsus marinus ATCC 50983]|uniref:Uncharacterized protein n=1 Tax=Perkinsus marinus (strain ATCC 50983 / TXsc) TaxID=423536 RepID=C5LJE5_PERM5|nr:hypothetical protein Pmar_PMAR018400 [Perkinsus marinus ATCC 50983]EER03145.1 hypothetical protein Pmar_PMAR018400 [Perkinsus marinus ATCC 50983]|eukprot:XP_002771329.1 hypothetical protein Pmar_PMAR018400 [Perkinsus marinus ATCC 50983]
MKLALEKLYFGLAGAALKRKPISPLYGERSLSDLEEPTAAHWLITELCADSTLYNLGQNVKAALPESGESDDGEESE